jgi:flagellar motility protein MotE (MotC chaperone)
LQELETQNQSDNDNAQDTISSLEDQFNSEKRKREDAEQEILKQKQVGSVCSINSTYMQLFK